MAETVDAETGGQIGGLPVVEALPRGGWRERLNDLRLDVKFRYVPFRGYYRLRSYRYARWKSPELGLLRHLVPGDRIALDVGANLGLVTHLLARLSPTVHAFEPNPYPLRVLRAVADRNVVLHPVAVSDQTGSTLLMVPRNRKGWSSNGAKLATSAKGDAVLLKVPMIRLDDLDLPPVGFLKVDVEGHEEKVLAGAAALIARDRPVIMLECEHIHVGERVPEVLARMRDAGYTGLMLVNGRLEEASRFDLARHQLAVDPVGGVRQDYVRNFIFLPR